jgi:hypothetical protein
VDTRLRETVEYLRNGNALAALGALEGVEEEMRYLNLALNHMARLANEIASEAEVVQAELAIEHEPPKTEDLVRTIHTTCHEQAARSPKRN